MDKLALRNVLGCVPAGTWQEGLFADNVAIALCSYFDSLPMKPQEEECEHGWTPWVIEQTNATLDMLAESAIVALTPNANVTGLAPGKGDK